MECDQTQQAAVEAVVKEAAARGRIDILVNNAGVPRGVQNL